MTCDIYGTEINKLNEYTENVNEVSRTHIPLEALMNDDSTLKGGMLSKNSSCESAWACLNDRFARLTKLSAI